MEKEDFQQGLLKTKKITWGWDWGYICSHTYFRDNQPRVSNKNANISIVSKKSKKRQNILKRSLKLVGMIIKLQNSIISTPDSSALALKQRYSQFLHTTTNQSCVFFFISLLKMSRQLAQQTASSGNLTVSLPSENLLFLLTMRRKEKRKKNGKERKVPEHYSKSACSACIFTSVILNINILILFDLR